MATLCVVSPVAESLVEPPTHAVPIRTTNRRIAEALEQGRRHSATFRRLVAVINLSNVIVYVTCDGSQTLPSGLSGQLTFLASAGGFRYVIVHVDASLSQPRLVAILGHELQHAREIAENDSIIDAKSLAHAYATHLGYASGRHTFDSTAAIRAGEQVLREVLGRE